MGPDMKRTNEDKPHETPMFKAKARLVLRGFEDPDLLSMKTAAPTASRLARMMLLATTVWRDWTIWCGDVKAAFLSGANFDRIIVVRLLRMPTLWLVMDKLMHKATPTCV